MYRLAAQAWEFLALSAALLTTITFTSCTDVVFSSEDGTPTFLSPSGDSPPPPAEPSDSLPSEPPPPSPPPAETGDSETVGAPKGPTQSKVTFICSDTLTQMNRGKNLMGATEAIVVIHYHQLTIDPSVDFDLAPEVCRSQDIKTELLNRQLPIPQNCQFGKPGRYSLHVIDPTTSQTPDHFNDLVNHVAGGGGLNWYDNAITIFPDGSRIFGEARIILDTSLSQTGKCDWHTAPHEEE